MTLPAAGKRANVRRVKNGKGLLSGDCVLPPISIGYQDPERPLPEAGLHQNGGAVPVASLFAGAVEPPARTVYDRLPEFQPVSVIDAVGLADDRVRRPTGGDRDSVVGDLSSGVRSVIGGIAQAVLHKELVETIPALVRSDLASLTMMFQRRSRALPPFL